MQLRHVIIREQSEVGRSTADVWCPICGTITTAYLWSWSGHGFKRCSNSGCQAKLYVSGPVEPNKMQPPATPLTPPTPEGVAAQAPPPTPTSPDPTSAPTTPRPVNVIARYTPYNERLREMDQEEQLS